MSEEKVRVKVTVVGGEEKYLEIPKGTSIEEVLKQSNIRSSEVTVSIRGQLTDPSHRITEDTEIIVAPKIKGG